VAREQYRTRFQLKVLLVVGPSWSAHAPGLICESYDS